MAHEIVETHEGLQLYVEHSPMALIRQRGGALDLVWQIRGPQDLELARKTIPGLIDLLITWDSADHQQQPKKGKR